MAKLIYAANMSLDGYIEDPDGKFDWSVPDDEVHQFYNDLVREVGIHLYGRRMYETMMVWETDTGFTAHSPILRDFAEAWQAAEKIVYSRTLETVSTSRTRIERIFDPEAVRKLKGTTRKDILIGGPGLAAYAFRADLIDECIFFLAPISLGGGKPALPKDVRVKLELLEARRFDKSMLLLRYRTRL